MVHVVPAHLAVGQHVILAPINDVEGHAQLLHHGGAGAAQVVRHPLAVRASGQDPSVVVAAVLEHARRAVLALFEHHLAVTQLLADRLDAEVAGGAVIREALIGMPCQRVQLLELLEGERRQVDHQVRDVILDVRLRREPFACRQVDVLPSGHGHLADAAQRRSRYHTAWSVRAAGAPGACSALRRTLPASCPAGRAARGSRRATAPGPGSYPGRILARRSSRSRSIPSGHFDQ